MGELDVATDARGRRAEQRARALRDVARALEDQAERVAADVKAHVDSSSVFANRPGSEGSSSRGARAQRAA